jgi:outer membrane protein assembly factor BamD (BamD/ComL family)
MRRLLATIAVLVTVAAGPAWGQTAIELKKELLPKLKKAQAEGKDLGEAGQFYKEADEALKAGQQEEAIELFKKAKEAWPAN